jgi:predicted metal-dependent peptidase
MSRPLIDIRLAQRDPAEIGGVYFPNRERRVIELLAPDWVMQACAGPCFVFLDEINAAVTKLHQAAAYQIVLEKRVGPFAFHAGTVVMAAGNIEEDRAIVTPLSSALCNRFAHYLMRPDVESWLKWAATAGMDERILAFVKTYGEEVLYKAGDDNAFPTPRSWEMASRVMARAEPADHKRVMAACVGAPMADQFFKYIEIYRKVDAAKIMAGGATLDFVKTPSPRSSTRGLRRGRLPRGQRRRGGAPRQRGEIPRLARPGPRVPDPVSPADTRQRAAAAGSAQAPPPIPGAGVKPREPQGEPVPVGLMGREPTDGEPGDPAVADAEHRRIAALRMQLLEMHPFWGYLLLQLRIVPAPDLPAFAATDCVRHIWFNPGLTRHLDHEQLGFVLVHEVGHQLFMSSGRIAGRDRHRWNMATDYAINRIVAAIEAPSGGLLHRPPSGDIPGLERVRILMDSKYHGMIAETIYERLCREEIDAPTLVKIVLRFGGAGSDAGDRGDVSLPNLPDHGGGIDVHLPADLSDEQRELLKERIAAAVENWKAHGGRGDAPGALIRNLGILERPRVPWQRLLYRFAEHALARDDYSLARPNKRYLEHDAVVPGPYGERTGQVVVALDTSGSMSAGILRAVGAEIAGIAAHVEEMILIVADAKVQWVVPFDGFEEFIKAGKVAGGGTDHRPVFAYMEEHRIRPRLFIGLSDLASRFPTSPPPCPVIWIVPQRHGKAPWGQVTEIASDPEQQA